MIEIDIIFRKSVLYFEGLALIFSLIYLKKYYETPSKLIPVYLFFVVLIEIGGLNRAMDQWMYNFLGIVELVIFTYIFYDSVRSVSSRRIIVITFLFCLLVLGGDIVFISNSIKRFLSFAFGFVSFGTAIMCFVYLYEMAKTEKVIHQNRILLYWVVIGLLIFHLCNLPITVLMHNLEEIGNVRNILIIQSIAAIGMYCCYILGFIWSKREYNY